MKKLGIVLLATSMLIVAGCDFKGLTVTPQGEQKTTARDPVVNVFTSNPATSGSWDQGFTFQVEAYAPSGNVLKYNWTATGGTLSATSGKLISWQPPKKAGTYVVSVSVIDVEAGTQAVSSANITITEDGSVNVAK